ncbi:hypothetical protein [Nonomuraea rosea]|uniref:hypothetical protein n=1 Tax=Nonomuraea rosea TaxID=638574 RepID=UPI0031E4FBD6
MVLGHGVAEQPAREQILDRGQIQLALVGVDLRHIADDAFSYTALVTEDDRGFISFTRSTKATRVAP